MVDAIKPLTFTVQSLTANELAIKLKNSVELERPMTMEIIFPKAVLHQKIRDAADAACGRTGSVMTLDTIVTGTEGTFSVWGKPATADHTVSIIFMNDLDKAGVEIEPKSLPAGSELIIRIPLDPEKVRSTITQICYSYEDDTDPRVDGKLELQATQIDWTPKVTLNTDHPSPTMIAPITEVKISWSIEDGLSGELRGPLPGGNAEWSLPISQTQKVSSGSFTIRAAGQMAYTLKAVVKGPAGRPNVEVTKTLLLDVYSKGKYAYVAARQERVLPNTRVEIDWAAWGVKAVSIEGNGGSEEFLLTDINLTGTFQGVGFWSTTAQKPAGEPVTETKVDIDLSIQMPKEPRRVEASTSFKVIPWRPLTDSNFTGAPIGLAVTESKMALLTTTGLWTTDVGETDSSTAGSRAANRQLDFSRSTKISEPKAWLALAALGDKFVGLRQTTQDTLQVALYTGEGEPDEILPVDLPPWIRPLMGRSGTVFDLAVFNNTVYVVVEGSLEPGPMRSAFSVRFDPVTKKGEQRGELLLEQWPGYRLLTFDKALYALNRNSGNMLRFGLSEGMLEASVAAPAATRGASMVKQGLPVSVGGILAVLSPTSVPSLTSLAHFSVRNVLKSKPLTTLRTSGPAAQDLVYNPQNDRWLRCGRALDDVAGVVAYRGGRSKRLWFIGPDKKTRTLTVSSEELFIHDYKSDGESEKLPLAFDDYKKRELMFINNTGMEFVEMNETCFKAGLKPFSSNGQVYLTSPLPTGSTVPHKKAEPVDLRYPEDATAPVATLRFLAKRGPGVKHEYVMEVMLSGPRVSGVTIGFKQLTEDAQGRVSVVEVPDKLQNPIALGLIEKFPMQLSNGIRLRINNATPYPLWLRSPDATTAADKDKKYDPAKAMEIRYNTPPFSIYAHGVGDFPVDVDFTLPNGIEMSPGSEVQKQRIRIRNDGPLPFAVDSVSTQKTNDYDAYEFTLRYKVQRKLGGAFLGDGMPSGDGASFYLPLVEPPGVTNAKILKIDANNLQTTAQIGVNNVKNIFYCPNSVAVLSDVVVAIMDGKTLSMWSHSLIPHREYPTELFEYDVVTNLKHSSGNSIFMLGMKETPTWSCTRSYKTESWHFAQYPNRESYGWLNFFKNFQPGRVPGAPAWVGLNTISPMDIRAGAAYAICVEGGIIGQDIKNDWKTFEVELPGTGRQEAILIDPTAHVVFSVHCKPPLGAGGLMVSRINIDRPGEKLTTELPGSLTHVVTDPRPPTDPKLDYYRPRAISLLATSDALFVSHAMKIYVLDKTTLTQRRVIPVALPTRLIQVRRVKLPGERTDKYDAPTECYLLWAIGSRYTGDGYTVKVQGQDFDTIIYKIAILP